MDTPLKKKLLHVPWTIITCQKRPCPSHLSRSHHIRADLCRLQVPVIILSSLGALVSAIWMLPRWNSYGDWPSSGEIDLVESRGNLDLNDEEGNEQVTSLDFNFIIYRCGKKDCNKKFKIPKMKKLRKCFFFLHDCLRYYEWADWQVFYELLNSCWLWRKFRHH